MIRWAHKEKVNPKDPEGCGTPVCVIVDAKPTRFSSLCALTAFLGETALQRQFFMVQKGDCADASMTGTANYCAEYVYQLLAVDGIGHDWHWGSKPSDACASCQSDQENCCQTICMAWDGRARTFPSVCHAMELLHARTDVVVALFALGGCKQLLSKDTCLYTEWFDIDEPCQVRREVS